jgi:hypothetical protein
MPKPSSSNKAPIYLRLMGGLGNQLFQYAAGRSLADRLGVELVLDDRYVVRKSQHTGLVLNAFKIRARFMDNAERQRFSEVKIRLARWFKKLIRPLGKVFWETQYNHDPSINTTLVGQLLIGFWQSEEYMYDLHQLRLDLELKVPLSAPAQKVSEVIGAVESVALHVRRGDYLKDQKTIARHGVCSQSYYQSAIDLVLAEKPKAEFFVFSDDPKWVKAHLKLPPQCTYVSAANIATEEDLVLMSGCKHQIIANSTFSWWGAWLNNSCDKIVVCPTPWFDDPSIATQDLLPAHWHQLAKN